MGKPKIIIFFFTAIFLITIFVNDCYSEAKTGNTYIIMPEYSKIYYISGLVDVINTVRSLSGLTQTPENVTYGQIQAVVDKYIFSHPEIRHQYMPTITAMALDDAFPSIKNSKDKPNKIRNKE